MGEIFSGKRPPGLGLAPPPPPQHSPGSSTQPLGSDSPSSRTDKLCDLGQVVAPLLAVEWGAGIRLSGGGAGGLVDGRPRGQHTAVRGSSWLAELLGATFDLSHSHETHLTGSVARRFCFWF